MCATAQLVEAGGKALGGAEGLYYYGARWYDPALGRFAQADTIIPEATQGTQAWDRYAYVNNSPVNRTDPTGHETVLCDEACENNNGSLAKKGKPVYGVTFVGSFTESEKAEIWAALLAISAKIGGAGVFNSVFEGLIFTRDTKLGGLGGQWNEDGTVHLNPALLTQYVVTHELGHVFHTKVYDIDYDNSPANQLVKAGNEIKDNRGNVVSGLDDGSYRRTDAGYQACPNRKGCRYEEHPTTIDIDADPPENPNNPGEDVADMFLNWVYDSFDYSDAAKGAGTARYEWWDSRMAGWIDTITR
jgi:RHS repeat-associated protein